MCSVTEIDDKAAYTTATKTYNDLSKENDSSRKGFSENIAKEFSH